MRSQSNSRSDRDPKKAPKRDNKPRFDKRDDKPAFSKFRKREDDSKSFYPKQDDDRKRASFPKRDDDRGRPVYPKRDDDRRGDSPSFKRDDDRDDRRGKPAYPKRDDDRGRSSYPKRDDDRKSYSSRPSRDGEKVTGYQKKQRIEDRYKKEGFDNRFKKRIDKSMTKQNEDGERLNKYIANSGICSRREADVFISSGVVSINGTVISDLGVRVMPMDVVRFNGEIIRNEKKVYIIMNKPKGFVTTTSDPHADKTIMDLFHGAVKERVFPVGRLDKNTTGVLLLTNDGDLTKKLTHPSYKKRKVYQATLDKKYTKADMVILSEGIELEDGFMKVDDISYPSEDKKVVGLEIHSGKNRIVRRLFEAQGYEVVKLDRVFFAGMNKKGLRRGEWRHLSDKELQMLQMGSYD